MRDFWESVVPLSAILFVAFFVYGIGQLIFADMALVQEQYEQCIAADKQWVQGSCVK